MEKYTKWINLEEVKIFAERNNITVEEEIKHFKEMGFVVIDFSKELLFVDSTEFQTQKDDYGA